jgi:hypothetical protein
MTFKSDFLRVLDERGFIHQISDPEGLDKRVLAKAGDGLHRVRLHGTKLARGLDAADHDAATGCSRPATSRSP